MSIYTPILIPLGILFLFQPAMAEEPKKTGKPEASDCQPVEDELDVHHKKFTETSTALKGELKKLARYANDCAKYPDRIRNEFIAEVEKIVKGYEKKVDAIHKELDLGLCKKTVFPSTDACEGAKQSMVAMLTGKKAPVQAAIEKTAKLSSEIAAYKKHVYFGQRSISVAIFSVSVNPYNALSDAFTRTEEYRSCSLDAIKSLHRVFLKDDNDKDPKALVNRLWKQAHELEVYLKKRSALIDGHVAEISKTNCATAVAQEPLKANLPAGSTTITGMITEQAVAPFASVDTKSSAAASLEVTEQKRAVEVPEVKVAEEIKAPVVRENKGSEGAVMAALQAEKEVRLNNVAVAAVEPTQKLATEKVAAATETLDKAAASSPVETVKIGSTSAKPTEGVKSIVEVEKLDREKDFWGVPNYRSIDTYKESIGLTSVVKDVNVNDYYKQWLASRSIDANQPDFGLRLQKAINATAGNDGDSLGPSTFQDGIVGSRTKSSIYLIQTNVAYNALFEQNLRKQGLIP